MATLDLVNIGAAADDGTGDPIRTAYGKNNNNLTAINAELITTTALASTALQPALFSSVTDGQLPSLSGSSFINSGIERMSTGAIMFQNEAIVEGNSKFRVGAGVTLASQNSQLFSINGQFFTSPSFTEFAFIDARDFRNAPSARPRQIRLTEAEPANPIVLQATNTDTLTANPFTFQITATVNSKTRVVVFEASAPMTNVRIRVRYGNAPNTNIAFLPSESAWESGTGGLTFNSGVNECDLGNNAFRTFSGFPESTPPIPADNIEVEVRADNISLLGTSTPDSGSPNGLPYLAVRRQLAEFKDLAYHSDITDPDTVSLSDSATITSTNVDDYNAKTIYVPTSVTTGAITLTIDPSAGLKWFKLIVLGNPTSFNIAGGTGVTLNGSSSVSFDQNDGIEVVVDPDDADNYHTILSNDVGASSDNYVDSVSLSLTNGSLQATLGRTGTLPDVSGSLNIPTWRGSHSTANTYLAGDVVTHLNAGVEKLYMAATAQAPNSGTPSGGAAIGAWRELDRVAGKGAWNNNTHYEFGDIVSHGNNYWLANTTIGLSQPAPSPANSDWVQIDGSGSGAGGAPTRVLVRQNTTLPASTVDNTIVVVDATGTGMITVTLPNVTSADISQNKRITVVNNRPDASAQATVAFASGDSIRNAFSDTVLLRAGEAAEFYAADENQWALTAEANVQLVPNFPSNSQNDTNTFFFAVNGDTSTTWQRDRNTAINMRSDNGNVSYELANPATSGIAVADGDGYVFRHTTGSNTAQIFPFAAGNQFFIGSTQYTQASPYTLPQGSSVAVIYDSSAGRWEGKVFNFLVGGSVGGSGASGSSQEQQNVFGDTGGTGFVLTATNSSTALKHGDVVAVPHNIIKATPAEVVDGMIVGDTEASATGMAKMWGDIPDIQIRTISGGYVSDAMSIGDDLYLSRGTGEDAMVMNNDDAGAHSKFAEVTGSRQTVPNAAAANRPLGTNVSFSNSTEFDDDRNSTVTFTGTGTNDYELPSFSVASVNVGDVLVISIPSGQTITAYGDTTGGTLDLRDQDGNQYTSTNKLSVTSKRKFIASSEEGVGSYWLALETDQDIVLHSLYFDSRNYNSRLTASQVYQLTVQVGGFNNRLAVIEEPLIVPTGATYIASTKNVIYQASPTSNTSHTITLNQGSVWNLTSNKTAQFKVFNASNTYWMRVINNAAFGNFVGTDVDTIWIAPQEDREFFIHYNGSSYLTHVVGEVAYDFAFEGGLFTGSGSEPSWTAQNTALPTEIVEIPSGNTDRIQFKQNCEIQQGRLDCQFLYTGSTPADATAAAQGFTFSAQALDGETITIGGKTYTFQTTLTDIDGNVLIGNGAGATAQNLTNAINLGSGSGTTYAASTTLHPTVSGQTITNGLRVRAKTKGAAGNSIAVSDTVSNGSWEGSTLSGGSDADFSEFTVLSPSFTLNKSGSVVQAFHEASVSNISTAKPSFHQEVDHVDVDADQYLNLTGTDFTDVTAATVTLRGRIVVKKA